MRLTSQGSIERTKSNGFFWQGKDDIWMVSKLLAKAVHNTVSNLILPATVRLTQFFLEINDGRQPCGSILSTTVPEIAQSLDLVLPAS